MNLASRLQTVAKPGSVGGLPSRCAGWRKACSNTKISASANSRASARPRESIACSGLSARREPVRRRFAARHDAARWPRGRGGSSVEAWRQAQETRRGRGYSGGRRPGMGKSRIVSVVRERLGERIVQTLVFQASPFFANTAFHPFISWFERALGFHQEDSAQTRLDKLELMVVDRFGFERDDLRLIASILSIPVPGTLRRDPAVAAAGARGYDPRPDRHGARAGQRRSHADRVRGHALGRSDDARRGRAGDRAAARHSRAR